MGHWTALVLMIDSNRPVEQPAAIRQMLPGYLSMNAKQYTLFYNDRRPWCVICKPCPPAPFHSRDDCPRLACHFCTSQGKHFPSQCAQNPDRNESNKKGKRKGKSTTNADGVTQDPASTLRSTLSST